jgi:carboxymethylenebutenolidase
MRTRAGDRHDTPAIAKSGCLADPNEGPARAAAPTISASRRVTPIHRIVSTSLSAMSHRIQIDMPDGGQMGAYVSLPPSGSGPGMLVLMEIFGVGVYIREAADRLAALGYVALAPDLYRRTRAGAEFAHDDAGLAEAMAAIEELDMPGAIEDAIIALEHLRGLPETGGAAGVLGFCLGGMLAFAVAQQADPATAVSYYGSGVADMLDDSAKIACPVLFQFGGEDAYIPREQAERVARAAQARAGWECHIHDDGGHAFDNWDAPRFSRPEAANRAWAQTTGFLARTLPSQSTRKE